MEIILNNIIYDLFIEDLNNSTIDFNKDFFKVMLIGPGYEPNGKHTLEEIKKYEIGSVGYNSGGKTIGLTRYDNIVRADQPVKWADLTCEIRYAVVYRVNGKSYPIMCQDLAGGKEKIVLNNSRISLDWTDKFLDIPENDEPTGSCGILGIGILGEFTLGKEI